MKCLLAPEQVSCKSWRKTKNSKELTLFPQSLTLLCSFIGPATLKIVWKIILLFSINYQKGFTWRKSLLQPFALLRSNFGRERLNVPLVLLILQLHVQMGLVACQFTRCFYGIHVVYVYAEFMQYKYTQDMDHVLYMQKSLMVYSPAGCAIGVVFREFWRGDDGDISRP